ncbi:MAG: DEAD/DEAH box helicase family protein [Aeriscardovia sp.]|nr:DEAD/DEAH box helicase family protein [Aeriscardovia sp.]
MRFELKDFQEEAVSQLLDDFGRMRAMRDAGMLPSACLSAPTGSGKTVMSAAVIEALFYGSDVFDCEPDPQAMVLWLSDSPTLNEQTKARFEEASDELAPFGDQYLETIGPDFCAGHAQLEPRRVYFLNQQMLSTGNSLVTPNEKNGGRLFWDVLENTVSADRHLVLFIDEAHRGFGGKKSKQSAVATIYQKLVSGVDGQHSPMPMVVGISATPDRFIAAMGKLGRTCLPSVAVDPKAVQDSGLLKDTIVLRVPEDGETAVEHLYLGEACRQFAASCRMWKNYCSEQGIQSVRPLMVVQVKDGTSASRLHDLCEQVIDATRGLHLRKSTSFANVFGEHQTIDAGGGYIIPYMEPETVQSHSQIRVLFAKEAISNGWDCPRAEVIYSERHRHDPTYIAQLIGRMVRTPLARRIDAEPLLNSAFCYLPDFDPQAAQSVVDYLTGKKDEFGGTCAKEIIVNAVPTQAPAALDAQEMKLLEERKYEQLRQEEEANRLRRSEAYRAKKTKKTEAMKTRQDSLGIAAGTPIASDSNMGIAPIYTTDSQEPEGESAIGQTDPALTDEQISRKLHLPKPMTDQQMREQAKREAETDCYSSFSKEEIAEIRRAYETIRVQRIHNKPRNEFKALLDVTTFLAETGIDPAADDMVEKDFCIDLDAEIEKHHEEYQRAADQIASTDVRVIVIDRRNADSAGMGVTERIDAVETDSIGLRAAAKEADKTSAFGSGKLTEAYRRHLAKKNGNGENEANLVLAAAARTRSVVDAMAKRAADRRAGLLEQHLMDRDGMTDMERSRYDALLETSDINAPKPLEWPSGQMPASPDWPRFKRHILQDQAAKNGTCPLNLNDLEQFVVRTEMGRTGRSERVAFYRNPADRRPSSFGIPFKRTDGSMGMVKPDFIFFGRDGSHVLRPLIVDPHGDFLADSVGKLKGYVAYLRDKRTHGADTFLSVISVSGPDGNGECRYLDLKDQGTQEAVLAYNGADAKALYTGEQSHKYGTMK